MKKFKLTRPREFSLKKTLVLCTCGMLAASALVFMFSEETRVQALTCTGNYYYSARQIYDLAGLNGPMRTWQHPAFQIEQTLKADPLIESAKVTKDGQNLNIDVQEKMVIGYYVKDNLNYMLTRDGQSIPIENPQVMKSLIHFPLLADLSDEQMQMICKEFQAYPDYLTRQVQEKIAEILPWSESYDPNMVKMVMQDGNIVFSSMNSLHMIANYQKMLTELQGENVCLVLDGDNQAIDKIACDYMYMTSQQRDEYRQELKAQLEKAKKEAEEEAKKQQEEQKKKEQEAKEENKDPNDSDNSNDSQNANDQNNPDDQNGTASDSSENTGQDASNGADQNGEAQPEEKPYEPQQADDWQDCQYSWLVYSPGLDIYQDKWGTNQYKWDESTMSFIQLK